MPYKEIKFTPEQNQEYEKVKAKFKEDIFIYSKEKNINIEVNEKGNCIRFTKDNIKYQFSTKFFPIKNQEDNKDFKIKKFFSREDILKNLKVLIEGKTIEKVPYKRPYQAKQSTEEILKRVTDLENELKEIKLANEQNIKKDKSLNK